MMEPRPARAQGGVRQQRLADPALSTLPDHTFFLVLSFGPGRVYNADFGGIMYNVKRLEGRAGVAQTLPD